MTHKGFRTPRKPSKTEIANRRASIMADCAITPEDVLCLRECDDPFTQSFKQLYHVYVYGLGNQRPAESELIQRIKRVRKEHRWFYWKRWFAFTFTKQVKPTFEDIDPA